MDHLHWVGKQYYTMKSFAKEAAQYGVTRRVSLNVAKKMSFGDRVYCAMKDGKTGVIFGYFIIAKITGLSCYATTLVTSTHENRLIDEGGDVVLRGCGEYIERATHAVRCELLDIIEILEKAHYECVDIGHPMVGGLFVTIPKVRLLDIPFRPGFRTFDGDGLRISAAGNDNKVKGQFYIDSDVAQPLLLDYLTECGWVQAVENYRLEKRPSLFFKTKITNKGR